MYRPQLSLYDSPAEPAVLVPVKSPLQDEVAAARVAASEAYSSIKDKTADARQTWLGLEKQGEGEYSEPTGSPRLKIETGPPAHAALASRFFTRRDRPDTCLATGALKTIISDRDQLNPNAL